MSACLASAIDYIHKRGLINGDLTGLNVLVSKKGKSKEVKITDYGLLYYKASTLSEENLLTMPAKKPDTWLKGSL